MQRANRRCVENLDQRLIDAQAHQHVRQRMPLGIGSCLAAQRSRAVLVEISAKPLQAIAHHVRQGFFRTHGDVVEPVAILCEQRTIDQLVQRPEEPGFTALEQRGLPHRFGLRRTRPDARPRA